MPQEPVSPADVRAFAASVRRRWLLIAAVGMLLFVGRYLGLASVPIWLAGCFAAISLAANVVLAETCRRGWCTGSLFYLLAALDVALTAIAVVYVGPGALIVAFFIVVAPHSYDPRSNVATFAAFAAAAAYVVATTIHETLFGAAGGVIPAIASPDRYVEAAIFLAVAWVLNVMPSRLRRRIDITRAVVQRAATGALSARAPATHHDELGQLERSLNELLQRIAATVSDLQREAEEVAACAQLSARSATGFLDSTERLASFTADLARGTGGHRSTAEAGHLQSLDVARHAETLLSRASDGEAGARQLAEATQRVGERIVGAADALAAIAAEARSTVATVSGLRTQSRRISGFAATIAKIARHTHVLALNAAIEAARAPEHGAGFAAVAEQVRTLAGDAGRSAREVTEVLVDVQATIEALAAALALGDGKLTDVARSTDEARESLDALKAALAAAAELLAETARTSRALAREATSLCDSTSRLRSLTAACSDDADRAARAMSLQTNAMPDLLLASQQLEQLARRIREIASRFAVQPADRLSETRSSD